MSEYKMVAYTVEGEKFSEQWSRNVEWFDRFKKKKNYRIQIFEKVKNRWHMIYNERGSE